MRHILIEPKRKIGKSTIIVGDFNTPLPVIVRSNRQKIRENTGDLNSVVSQLDLTDTQRTVHPTTASF